MFTCSWIYGIVVFCAVALPGGVTAQPSRFPPNITTCEKFEVSARFNPYAVIDSMWKIFYFWSNNTELVPIVFSLAAKTVRNIYYLLILFIIRSRRICISHYGFVSTTIIFLAITATGILHIHFFRCIGM